VRGNFERAEVLGRVKGQTLRLVDAAKMLEVSYRQAKRLWQRYREEGAKGLQHRSAGRSSNGPNRSCSVPEYFSRISRSIFRRNFSGFARSGQPSECCDPGSGSMGYRERCIPIGRTSISGSRRQESACAEKSQPRSLGACARDWRFALFEPVLRRRKGAWSATTGCIKIAW
jgi:helix-turn-helix protein